jgi:hypothetical protein
LTEGYQTYTYSDDFSYYAAGVPSLVNGFLFQKDQETVFQFYREIYHTQYDTADTYNEAVMVFNLKYYGVLAMFIDQTPALYLDFTSQYDRVLASVDNRTMADAEVNINGFVEALGAMKEAAEAMKARVEAVTDAYWDAFFGGGDGTDIEELRETGRGLTRQNLAAFAYAQEGLLGLMYERPIVPHEAPLENIRLCEGIITFLEEGRVAHAVDEEAWKVNNVLEWYAMYFSPDVIDVQDDMFWGESNAGNLYWGTGRNFIKADVEEATRSLVARYDEDGADFSREIAIYQESIHHQRPILTVLTQEETETLQRLAEMLK